MPRLGFVDMCGRYVVGAGSLMTRRRGWWCALRSLANCFGPRIHVTHAYKQGLNHSIDVWHADYFQAERGGLPCRYSREVGSVA